MKGCQIMMVLGHKVRIIKYGNEKHVYIDDKFDSQYPVSTTDLKIVEDIRWIIKHGKS